MAETDISKDNTLTDNLIPEAKICALNSSLPICSAIFAAAAVDFAVEVVPIIHTNASPIKFYFLKHLFEKHLLKLHFLL